VVKGAYTIPAKIKKLALTKEYMQTSVCAQTTASVDNYFNYNDLDGPEIPTTGNNKVSFTFWHNPNKFDAANNNILMFSVNPFINGNPINNNFLLLRINSTYFNQFSLNNGNSLSLAQQYIETGTWTWFFTSIDITTQQQSIITYRSVNNTYTLMFTTAPWAALNFPDMALWAGTQNDRTSTACGFNGHYTQLMEYLGITAKDVLLNIPILKTMMRYADEPFMAFSIGYA
jgi:hypothetical protein